MLPRLKRTARDKLCEAAARLLAAWVGGKSPATCRAYAGDLAAFAQWAGVTSSDEAVAALLGLGPKRARAAAERWRDSMGDLAPRTCNRRLASLRSLVRTAKRRGAIAWDLDVWGRRVRGFVRDTRGPTAVDIARVIRAVESETQLSTYPGSPGLLAVRDLAVLLLLNDSGLRRAEVCSLHVRHVDMARRVVQIEEKGSDGGRQWWPISYRAFAALRDWFQCRGRTPGPVFTATTYGARDAIDGSTVYRIVRRRSEAVGLSGWRPHGLRHSALTVVQNTTHDLALTQRFGRHASPDTTTRHYLDTEPEDLRQLVEMVAAASGGSAAGAHASARSVARGVRSPLPPHAAQR